ncbi:YidC/Oxa1 family membrane protein insertase [Streptomyces paromomycinus]|uniref:Membrane protein insertase YidC n=1 Tax=Streptomyces paromomycinus TaxID=92743 RepID=A0A401W896_STREY|nr:membrane protein insertase YidC [Streptomyces paromomycinus]GCD45558.1 membrane protein [Streptomyces paromomycinus]
MSVFATLGGALSQAADLIEPLFGASATAAAIILCTLCVRAALHPLARVAARGEKTRSAHAPRLAELRRTYAKDPQRLREETAALYAETGSSPLAGCLPALLQLPVFFVMYHLFTSDGSGLLAHTLLGAPLGGHWTQALADGGPVGPHGLVYLALFALAAAVATWNYLRARTTMARNVASGAALGQAGRADGGPADGGPADGGAVPGLAAMTKAMPLLSFGTLVSIAVLPLAAALYLVTTTAWTACERALLYRGRDRDDQGGDSQDSQDGDGLDSQSGDGQDSQVGDGQDSRNSGTAPVRTTG